MSTDLEVRQSVALETMGIEELVGQTRLIQQAMAEVMKEDEHFGTIPGTNKPTLLKPGAEKLCLLFRFDPQYDTVTKTETMEMVSYTVTCTLFHIPTGTRVASGMGQANSFEDRYRWRWTTVETPSDRELVEEMKAAGTGRFRKDRNQKWIWQVRQANENPMDLANTLLKMACKRALIAAVLNATAASDIFTQDLEDLTQKDAATERTLDELQDALRAAQGLDDGEDLWSWSVVAENASRRFGKNIRKPSDLTETEAKTILQGALSWAASHQQDSKDEDVEVIPTNEVEVEDGRPESGDETG